MADKSIVQFYNFQLIDPNGVMPKQAENATHIRVSSFKSSKGYIVTYTHFAEVENRGDHSLCKVKPLDGFAVASERIARVTDKILRKNHENHLPWVHEQLKSRFGIKLTDMSSETVE